ncbi:hypothetical protein DDE18_15565 [Nocardioides gansuensis]|uniref:Uncharacterized protein n=1 Tax=Nocardioides gansuensis TaxID=2138300 RepID=A0A2T8F8P6_9ACTN|nr:hypothetical protein [Nocardioides gansuensis]PVG82096.1 hypothetical protein DDE18_15565 [Nocardioides gansuensis]
MAELLPAVLAGTGETEESSIAPSVLDEVPDGYKSMDATWPEGARHPLTWLTADVSSTPGRVTASDLDSPRAGEAGERVGSRPRYGTDGDRIALDRGELHFVVGERDGIAAFHVEALWADAAIGGIRFVRARNRAPIFDGPAQPSDPRVLVLGLVRVHSLPVVGEFGLNS